MTLRPLRGALGQTLSTRARHVLLVGLVALAGLAVAVALALVTSHLTTQHVGLAGEPTRPAPGLVGRTKTVTVVPATTPSRTDPNHHDDHEHGDD